MGQILSGYWVTLKGSGGELGKEFCTTESQAQIQVKKYADIMEAGDTISMDEGTSER